MAKLKAKSAPKAKPATKTKARSGGKRATSDSLHDIQHKAEQVSRSIVESAQQIWLAGVGAFGRAQEEGTRLFEALVKEGMNMEKTTRDLASHKVGKVRDAVEDRVEQARERATDTWDRLEKVFEERVQRALTRLGVPGREELIALSERVDKLTAELRKQAGAKAGGATDKTSDKPAGRSAASRAGTARKATASGVKASKAAESAGSAADQPPTPTHS